MIILVSIIINLCRQRDRTIALTIISYKQKKKLGPGTESNRDLGIYSPLHCHVLPGHFNHFLLFITYNSLPTFSLYGCNVSITSLGIVSNKNIEDFSDIS